MVTSYSDDGHLLPAAVSVAGLVRSLRRVEDSLDVPAESGRIWDVERQASRTRDVALQGFLRQFRGGAGQALADESGAYFLDLHRMPIRARDRRVQTPAAADVDQLHAGFALVDAPAEVQEGDQHRPAHLIGSSARRALRRATG